LGKMNIVECNSDRILEIPYQMVDDSQRVVDAVLPVTKGVMDGLPSTIDTLIVAEDLQGRGRMFHPGKQRKRLNRPDSRLLGVILAEAIAKLTADGHLPPSKKIGVILAGDLHVKEDLESRGGSGDVRHVWTSFRSVARWVAGVAGNHDEYGSTAKEAADFAGRPGIHLLDGDSKVIDGKSFAGVGGVIGRKKRLHRRREDAHLEILQKLLQQSPGCVILHQGPDIPGLTYPGNPAIRTCLEESKRQTLVICGHRHWPSALATLEISGSQVCNVDSRVIVFTRRMKKRRESD
jgi:3',5'-cyclic-AMP phosphodiesterase